MEKAFSDYYRTTVLSKNRPQQLHDLMGDLDRFRCTHLAGSRAVHQVFLGGMADQLDPILDTCVARTTRAG